MHAWRMHVGICMQGMHAPTYACMACVNICMPEPMCTSTPHPTAGRGNLYRAMHQNAQFPNDSRSQPDPPPPPPTHHHHRGGEGANRPGWGGGGPRRLAHIYIYIYGSMDVLGRVQYIHILYLFPIVTINMFGYMS